MEKFLQFYLHILNINRTFIYINILTKVSGGCMIATMKQVGGRRRLRTRTKTARGSAGAAQSLRLGLRRPTSLYIPKGISFASQREARAQSLLGAVFSGLLWATLWRPLSRPQADSVSLRLGHGAALTCHRHVIHYRAAALLPKRGAKTSLLPNGNTPTLETPQALTRHCLATARSRRGSDLPPACHSLPRRRFAA